MVDNFANALTHHTIADVVVFPPAVFVERFANQALYTVACGVPDIGGAVARVDTGDVAG